MSSPRSVPTIRNPRFLSYLSAALWTWTSYHETWSRYGMIHFCLGPRLQTWQSSRITRTFYIHSSSGIQCIHRERLGIILYDYPSDVQVEAKYFKSINAQCNFQRQNYSQPEGGQGMGAIKAVAAQAAEQVPKAKLHPRIAAGATGAITVPNVKPAAA